MASHNTCSICGKLLPSGAVCPSCKRERPSYEQTRSLAVYQGITAVVIKEIKYNRRIGLVPCLTQDLVNALNHWHPPVDMIAPVPLAKKRQRSRGFNQSDLIARPLAKNMNQPYFPRALKRIRETQSQVGLGAAERRENLIDAFVADPKQCTGKSVLLIDDITTTGTTLNECAKALKNAGAEEVYCFTVASTQNLMMEVRK